MFPIYHQGLTQFLEKFQNNITFSAIAKKPWNFYELFFTLSEKILMQSSIISLISFFKKMVGKVNFGKKWNIFVSNVLVRCKMFLTLRFFSEWFYGTIHIMRFKVSGCPLYTTIVPYLSPQGWVKILKNIKFQIVYSNRL